MAEAASPAEGGRPSRCSNSLANLGLAAYHLFVR
jgi:hypothetical protein